jgi:hypothetical protein
MDFDTWLFALRAAWRQKRDLHIAATVAEEEAKRIQEEARKAESKYCALREELNQEIDRFVRR